MDQKKPQDSFSIKILDDNAKIEMINRTNQFILFDYVFPFHLIIPTKEKIPYLSFEDKSMDYYSSYLYYTLKRYEMISCFNKKYDKFLNNYDRYKLRKAETIYSTSYLACYLTSLFFIIKRPLKYKLFNFYFFCYFLFFGKVIGFHLTKPYLNDIKYRINVVNKKIFKMKIEDLYDDTIIPDWKCYLYYYGFI